MVLRRARLGADSFSSKNVFRLDTPAGNSSFLLDYSERDYRDWELLLRWMGDEKIEKRWKTIRSDEYDLSNSNSVPPAYRFKVVRKIGPVRNLEQAYYLLEIAGTAREPVVIATYLIRHSYVPEGAWKFFGTEIVNKILDILIQKDYFSEKNHGFSWTNKLELELGTKRTGVHHKPQGEIISLTDFQAANNTAEILCRTHHPTQYDDTQRAILDNDLHGIYHFLDEVVER